MLETLDRVLSVGSWISSAKDLHDKYKTLCAIHYGETAFQKLDQKIERIAERILYAPDLQGVVDTNQTTQQVYRDRKQIHDALEPVQRVLNQDILSSAMILTPERMQQALITNPFEVLCDPRPINFFDSSRMPPEGVPVMFEIDGMKYLGWQLKGTLPFLFNCRYDELWIPPAPSIISTPISPPVSTPQTTTDFIVSPNGQYPTINSALKAAKDGDKIIVKTGLYKESIIIDKDIELIADGSPIIESVNDCIIMESNHALIKGFSLKCFATKEANMVGVYISKGKLTLDSCDITSNSLACVQVNGIGSHVTLHHCKIHDGHKGGIFIYEQATGVIKGCDIYNNKGNGMVIYKNGSCLIEYCNIYDNQHVGIEIKESKYLTIRYCTIKNNGHQAIWVHDNSETIVECCDLRNNKYGSWAIAFLSKVQKRNNQE